MVSLKSVWGYLFGRKQGRISSFIRTFGSSDEEVRMIPLIWFELKRYWFDLLGKRRGSQYFINDINKVSFSEAIWGESISRWRVTRESIFSHIPIFHSWDIGSQFFRDESLFFIDYLGLVFFSQTILRESIFQTRAKGSPLSIAEL